MLREVDRPFELEPQPPSVQVKFLFGHHGRENINDGTTSIRNHAQTFYGLDTVNGYFLEVYGMTETDSGLYLQNMSTYGALDGYVATNFRSIYNSDPTKEEKRRYKNLPAFAWRREELQLVDELRDNYSIVTYMEALPDEKVLEIQQQTDEADKQFTRALEEFEKGHITKALKYFKQHLILDVQVNRVREQYIKNQINSIISQHLEAGTTLRLLVRFGTAHLPLYTDMRDEQHSPNVELIESLDNEDRYFNSAMRLEWKIREGYEPTYEDLILSLFSKLINQVSDDWALNTNRTEQDINRAQRILEEAFSVDGVKRLLRSGTKSYTVGQRIVDLLENAA